MGTTPREPQGEQLDGTEHIRLLVLTPFPPRLDAAHGGARVVAQLLTHLGDRMPIAVLCLRHPSELPADEHVRGRVARLEEMSRPDVTSPSARGIRFLRWRAAALFRGRPFWVSDLWLRAYRERVREVVREFEPNVVQFEYTAMAQYLGALAGSGVGRVLVEHDPEAGAAGAAGTLTSRLDARAWRRFRRQALRRVDAAVVFTERDRAAVERSAGDTPVVRIPFGADLADGTSSPAESNGSLLFVGNFVHPPNVDAARRLVASIFPRLRDSHPGCVLYIVGDRPPPELLRDPQPGVTVTGWVADLAPYMERAAVVVAPMRKGGGMRVKVLDALAAGKAVVASPLSTEGLDVADGEQLRVATTDDDFVARIGELLDDERARKGLEERARSWASENLTWEASVEAYVRLYGRLVSERRADNEPEVAPQPARQRFG
jgi:glycosyltransferase involved in cell wall biosynthesis